MATLAQKQRKFTLLVSQLIQHIYANEHEATMGDAYRDPRVHGEIGEKKSYSHPSSNHKIRLAIDLNLFKDGKYLQTTDAHKPFGEFWESLDPNCRWGGRYNDGNHYEYTPAPWR